MCHKSDNNFSECMKGLVENLKPILLTGDVGNGIKVTPISQIPMEE